MRISFLNTSTSERRDVISYDDISKTLMLLAMPLLMMGLVQSMMPLSDGLFINNITGPYVANAVTYCMPILSMVVALSQGLDSAGIAVIGQTSRRGSSVQGKKISSQLILLAFLFGIISIPVMVLLAFPISAVVTKGISDTIWLYLVLNAFATPLYLMEAAYNAIKNAAGQPEAAFVRMLLLLLLKILFNFPFIYLIPLDIIDYVIPSVLSNVIVCVIMFCELFIRESEEKLEWPGAHLDHEIAVDLLRIGLPTILSSVMMNLGFYLINNEVQKYGAIVLNGRRIASNITSICFAATGAFGPTVATVVSMNMGMRKEDHARRSMQIAYESSALTAVALIALIVPFVDPLIGLFTHNQGTLDIARTSLYTYIYSAINFSVCVVQQGTFTSLGRTCIPLVIGILHIWLLRCLFILAAERHLSVLSVFWSNLFSNLAAALVIMLMVLRMPWESVLPDRAPMPQERRG